MSNIGVADSEVTELDWWGERELRLGGGSEGAGPSGVAAVGDKLRVVCTPCQHFTGRSLTDRNDTLWASWSVSSSAGGKVWFGGASSLSPSPPPRLHLSPKADLPPSHVRRRRHGLPHRPSSASRPVDPARVPRVQADRRARGPARPRHDPDRRVRPAVALQLGALRSGGLGRAAPRDEVQEVDRCVLSSSLSFAPPRLRCLS